MTVQIDATYSPEDNKLRLYASERLDEALYARVKAAGFKWAPKQDLFVAPGWSPEREDLCIELAGEITAEQTTVAERAEAKAARLEALAGKREREAYGYVAAAERISERFAFGQPILVGHHSERKARKDQEKMNNAMCRSVACFEAVDYWNYRASAVERHANQKTCRRTTLNRIKTLLADLRTYQRRINHGQFALARWQDIAALEDERQRHELIDGLSGAFAHDGHFAPELPVGDKRKSMWSALRDGDVTPDEALQITVDYWVKRNQSPYYFRWVSHLLNRLAYERAELGEVPRFEGALTPVIIQGFARAHGADKPKATKTGDGFMLVSNLPLPVHIGEGTELTLSDAEWRDLMQGLGYEVIITERAKSTKPSCPLINPTPEQAEKLQALWNADAAKGKYGRPNGVSTVTQAVYSRNSKGDYSPFNTIKLDQHGRRIWSNRDATPVCRVRTGGGRSCLHQAEAVVVIEDKPQKALPLDLTALLSEAQTQEAS
ncbi:MAG: DUF3560 domain-containing protein [Pseudomonadota bacterium]